MIAPKGSCNSILEGGTTLAIVENRRKTCVLVSKIKSKTSFNVTILISNDQALNPKELTGNFGPQFNNILNINIFSEKMFDLNEENDNLSFLGYKKMGKVYPKLLVDSGDNPIGIIGNGIYQKSVIRDLNNFICRRDRFGTRRV